MGFRELTDEQWSFLQGFMPPPSRRGRPRLDDRRVLNGILYVLTTGCRWADIPREYGHPTTVWRRLRRLQEEGIWQKILKVLLELGYSRGKIDLSLAAIDSTTIKAQKGGSLQEGMAIRR